MFEIDVIVVIASPPDNKRHEQDIFIFFFNSLGTLELKTYFEII